ncbi:MAG: biopolymer transporter ExbD [Cyclobacteriaceae bacterium]|nr:biopolymer transporter ExbD [Cyclobacteriaceae bacterium]MCH8516684.1 biopolymer transporter ExbD [Cyclobacteriaceae bacterium]
MARSKKRGGAEVNAGSMADIAFLLLIFFLVVTTIATDKGLTMTLPPKKDPDQPPPDIKKNERNIFKVSVNSKDRIMVEDELLDESDIPLIREQIKEFILNYGRDPKLSDDPEEAVVSFKTDRGTSYEIFIALLNEMQGAYYEIWGSRLASEGYVFRSEREAGEIYRQLDLRNPRERELSKSVKDGIPMNISIAEPTSIGD